MKQIELEGFKEEEIVRLTHEVERVKQLSHPNIVKYEGMTRNKNILSIVLECVSYPPYASFLWLWRVLSSDLGPQVR